MRRRGLLDPGRGPVRRPRARRSAGFTLIEVIVAIVLLGVGLMGLAALSTTVTRANVQSSSLTTATALAQERAERLRTEDYDALASGNDSRVVDNVAYTRSWVVTAEDPEPGLKTVAIAVSWTTRGTTHTTRLTTIRGRR
jgi:type IV pilus assembly protein PilV